MAEEATNQPMAANPSIAVPALHEEPGIDPVAVFQTLLRGRRTILGLTLGLLAVATAIAFLLPPMYTSTVSFIPPQVGTGSSMASAVAGQLSALGAGDLLGSKNPGDLYAGILRSRSISGEIVKRFDLMNVYRVKKESQAEKTLGNNTGIVVDVKSSIVTVDVTDKLPQRAHDMANAFIDALRETDGRLALSQSSQRRMFFGQQLAKEKDDLEEAEVDLKKTEEQSGLIAPAGQTAVEINTIAATRAQIAGREVQLAAMKQSSTEQNPEVIRLRSEIVDLESQLSRLENGSRTGASGAIPASKVPELQLEYVRKEREVKYHEALFDILSRQYESARLDEARDAPVVQVLDPPSYPDSKSAPKRMYIMAGAFFFGLAASCAWVLARERILLLRKRLAQPASL